MEQDIFHRQRLINGWDQARLAQAHVAIVGSDWLAGYCALILACLGEGRIYLLDNAKAKRNERFFFPPQRGDSRAQKWADWLMDLGFTHPIIARHTSPVYGSHVLLPPVDAIISATNGTESQQALAHHAAEQSIPLVIGAADPTAGAYAVVSDHSTLQHSNTPLLHYSAPQGALPSAIIAALIVEELRRFLMPLPDDCPLPPDYRLTYNPSHPHRFASSDERLPIDSLTHLPIDSVLLVGAGALGTWAALGLAMRGDIESFTIIDPDYVEVTNLNRQPLFLRAVGDGKAVTLAKQLRKIQPVMQIDYIDEPVSAEHFDRCRPDLVLSCVDSFAPRKLIHDECLRRGIPLINGGTSAFSGHLEVYCPGKTACFNCLYTLDALAAREAQERADPARCQRTAEASIVTTNALVGACIAAEAGNLDNPLRQVLHYDAHLPRHFRFGYARKPCHCYQTAQENFSERGDENLMSNMPTNGQKTPITAIIVPRKAER